MLPENTLAVLAFAYLACVLLVAVAHDLRSLIIPNACNAAILAGALVFATQSSTLALSSCILGGLIGGAALLLMSIGFRALRGYDGLGLGDAKYMAGAGTWVGWQGLAPLLLVASVTALLYVAAQSLRNGGFDPRTRIPFAPFLGAATLVVWLLQVTEAAPWLPPVS
jgi:leader peptidase (prepilin peptidase)/N-methyltransferase